MSAPDLKVLEDSVRDLRDKEREIVDLEDRLKELRAQVRVIKSQTLPELFYEARVDHVGLPAEGNRPAIDAKLRKEYKASIPESWPDNKRQAAFNTLDELDLSDLQKITFTVIFEAGNREPAAAFSAQLKEQNLDFSVKRAVHHATLTAALKERCESGHVPSLAQLEAIGGFIGTSVDLRTRKG
jgi:hypothetical protein